MKSSEAVRLASMLAAYWRADMPDETLGLWSNSLTEFEIEDGMEAAHILGESGRFMPSLADFVSTIRDCRNMRLRTERRPALPGKPVEAVTFAEFLRDNPDWAERVRKLDRKGPFGKQPVTTLALGRILEEGL